MLFKMPKMLLLTLASSSLMSCAANTTETVRTVHDYCLLAKGITYSQIHDNQAEDATNKYDTKETVQQITDHDLVYETTCSGNGKENQDGSDKHSGNH